ncbi:2'-5' RNA ligase family protein [Streptomyces sp. NPDC049590]|uniref:2'-5' RNA ligase family protein n=1 Tax=Streptomyces sp. NPDC049590 TaxID=3154834 RepID=UPI003440BBA2
MRDEDDAGTSRRAAVGGVAAPDALAVAPTPRTAVARSPPSSLWPPVQGIRRELDPQVRRWPPQVNPLSGFVPEEESGRAVPLLCATAAYTPAFPARLSGVRFFRHRHCATVRLDPAAGPAPWGRLHREPAAERAARLGVPAAPVEEVLVLSRRGAGPCGPGPWSPWARARSRGRPRT